MDISGEGTSKGSNRLTQVYLENGCKSNACNCKRRVSYASYDDVVASAKEVLFSSAFLCLFVSGITQKKNYSTYFTKFGGKAVRSPRKKPLDFGDKPEFPITLRSWLG